MIFPIGDDNSDRTSLPVVNYLLIAANILVFVFLQGFGENDKFTYAYSTVPEEIITNRDIDTVVPIKDPISQKQVGEIDLQPTPVSVYITLITAVFMHGGFAHLFGNMLFLWIFGDNIENSLGKARYLLFYLVCGVIASLSHVFATVAFSGNRFIPSLGASGAISGVLGAYILLFPSRKVRVIMFSVFTEVPAFVAIGLWFVFQIVSGLGWLGSGSAVGGVAYGAHIGGFIAGLVLIKLFAIGRNKQMRIIS